MNATVATLASSVAFFVELHCNAAPQQEEEGDDRQLPSPFSWSYVVFAAP
jgi:hypothetical protein